MTEDEPVRRHAPDADGVGVVEIRRGPENYLTVFVLRALADALEELAEDPACRSLLVRSEGKHFCAGRDWTTARDPEDTAEAIYAVAPRFVSLARPWTAELTGGSIGVGMGLAMCADYRVAADSAYLWPKFVGIGIHHGFGLTATLPWVAGPQRATELLSTGRRIGADEAARLGLADRVAPARDVAAASHEFAALLAAQPPRALGAIRTTMRAPLRERFLEAIAHERAVQATLYDDADFQDATRGGYRYAGITERAASQADSNL